MKELQTIEVQNLLQQIPEDIQEKLSKYSDVKEVCEFLVGFLKSKTTINNDFGFSLVEILYCITLNSDMTLYNKAQLFFKSALYCQNYLQLELAEKRFLEARDLYQVVGETLIVQNITVYLAINCIYLSKFAEAQRYLFLAEESMNFKPSEKDVESIGVLCRFFKAVNFVHLATASRKGYSQYTEKIYNFFQEFQTKNNWDNTLLADYYLLLTCTVEASMLIKKYWLAYTILKELPTVIEHANTFPETKVFAQNDIKILEFELMMRVGIVQKNNLEQIEEIFETIESTYFEFFTQKLNISIILCEYYFGSNNVDEAKKWFRIFEKLKIETERFIIPEETGYIEFYNQAIQFFSEHGDTSLAQKYMEINTKLHKEALEKADNFRFEELKLWKYLQKEQEQRIQLELHIESVKQQLLTQIDSSLTLNQLLNDFSKTIHSTISDFPEKKQHQLLKQVKKYNEVQKLSAQISKFDIDFSAVFPLFSSNFLQKHPSVTKTEVQVCMAVLMNLSNQHIADFFHKEVKTIEEYIRRIRRKLQLEQRANLKAYLLLWTK